MGNERYNAPAPHERTLPHVPVNEQGLRELEIWLLARLRKLLLSQVRSAGTGWRFNVLNGADGGEHGYGYVQTDASIDLDETPDPLAVGGDIGFALVDDSGQGLLLGSNLATLFLKARGGDLTLLADGVPSGGPVTFNLNINSGTIYVNLEQSGDTFAVIDHLGSPLVTYTG